MIRTSTVTVATSGSAGSATGSAVTDKPVSGYVYAVYVDYGSAPATTDIVIEETKSPALQLLSVSDANTDGWFTQSDFVESDLVPFNQHLEVSVTGANNANTITVYIRWLTVDG